MLKTLSKHASKQRATIPILGTVRVKDGIATTTDMDFWVSAPVTGFVAADGDEDLTYFPQGFEKGIRVKTTLPATDFPDPTELGKPMIDAVLGIEQIKAMEWTLKAASTEQTRYYLNGVYFSPAGEIVATDGHRLHGFKAGLKFHSKGTKKNPLKGVILPTRAVALILEAVKETKAHQINIWIYDNNRFGAAVGKIRIEGKLIDGTYPNYMRVLPKKSKDTKLTIWNPDDLKALKAELQIYAQINGDKRPSLLIGDKVASLVNCHNMAGPKSWPITSQVLTSIGAGGATLKHNGIGFNAKYLEGLCAGTMEYTDACSPILIRERRGGVGKFCVLMPLRV